MLPRLLLATLSLGLLLPGCTVPFQLLVRNLGAEALTLRVYSARSSTPALFYVPLARQVLPPHRRATRQLTDTLAVRRQGTALVVTLPPHSTALLSRLVNYRPDIDSVRLERPGHPAQVLDSTTLGPHLLRRPGVGSGQVWLDFP